MGRCWIGSLDPTIPGLRDLLDPLSLRGGLLPLAAEGLWVEFMAIVFLQRGLPSSTKVLFRREFLYTSSIDLSLDSRPAWSKASIRGVPFKRRSLPRRKFRISSAILEALKNEGGPFRSPRSFRNQYRRCH